MPAQAPSEIHKLFLEAFNRGDVEALVALYEPGAVLMNRGQSLAGYEQIRQAYHGMVARHGRMELQTRSVVESADGLAVLHAAWSLQLPASDGGTRTIQGISTELVRRQPDGTWLFVVDEPSTPS